MSSSESATLDVLVMMLDRTHYALPLDRVLEAARRVTITPLPAAPAIVLGLVVHRGVPIPAIDLRARLGQPARPASLGDHLVVARAARRNVALVVDQVLETRSLAASRIHPPVVPDPQIAGIAVVEDDLWMIEDLDALLSLDEETALDRAMEASPR